MAKGNCLCSIVPSHVLLVAGWERKLISRNLNKNKLDFQKQEGLAKVGLAKRVGLAKMAQGGPGQGGLTNVAKGGSGQGGLKAAAAP